MSSMRRRTEAGEAIRMTYRIFVGWRGVPRFLGRSRDGQFEGVEESGALRFSLVEAVRLAAQCGGRVC
jgi:hypothetical protein